MNAGELCRVLFLAALRAMGRNWLASRTFAYSTAFVFAHTQHYTGSFLILQGNQLTPVFIRANMTSRPTTATSKRRLTLNTIDALLREFCCDIEAAGTHRAETFSVDLMKTYRIAKARIALPEPERLRAQFVEARKRLVEIAVERGKGEILEAISQGQIPATVASFAELHDHVDANEFGGAFEEQETTGEDGKGPLDIDFWDDVQTELDKWIKAGGADKSGGVRDDIADAKMEAAHE